MHQSDRETDETHRDGAATRLVCAHREKAPTNELPLPRRKRYTVSLDLDAVAAAEADPRAPHGPLDL